MELCIEVGEVSCLLTHCLISVWCAGAQTRVMYNRVGKCGSRATLTLLEAVAGRNNFTLVLSDIHNQRELSLPEQVGHSRITLFVNKY